MKTCFSAERGVSHVTDGGKIPPRRRAFEAAPTRAWIQRLQGYLREIGKVLPNNRRQRGTCYAMCQILYPVSAAHTSIFRMDSNSTSYQGYLTHKHPPPPRTLLQAYA